MEKKTLAELNLMDDFLFEEAMQRGEKGERFAKILSFFDRCQAAKKRG